MKIGPFNIGRRTVIAWRGARSVFLVGKNTLVGKVTTLMRPPASDVKAVSSYVMDMVAYLVVTYPESSFDQIEAPELLIEFLRRAHFHQFTENILLSTPNF